MTLTIPARSLVFLIGVSGAGKSTFARKHFRPSEVLSSDHCRYLVADDENDQSATQSAFEVLRFIAARRLRYGRLTVVDATNVQPEARQPLLALARECQVLPVAIVLNVPEHLCAGRNQTRSDRTLNPSVISYQANELRNSLDLLDGEGFRQVHILNTLEEVDSASIKVMEREA